MKKIFLTAFILILLDQILKIWIKTSLFLGQEIQIFEDKRGMMMLDDVNVE